MLKVMLTLSGILLFSVNVFAGTITYECKFSSFSNSKGTHKEKTPMVLKYLIDDSTKKAYFLGNLGSSEVTPITSDSQISFVEVTDSGNLMTTTIVDNLQAVHSRNTVMLGTLLPSQYYGSCVEK